MQGMTQPVNHALKRVARLRVDGGKWQTKRLFAWRQRVGLDSDLDRDRGLGAPRLASVLLNSRHDCRATPTDNVLVRAETAQQTPSRSSSSTE